MLFPESSVEVKVGMARVWFGKAHDAVDIVDSSDIREEDRSSEGEVVEVELPFRIV